MYKHTHIYRYMKIRWYPYIFLHSSPEGPQSCCIQGFLFKYFLPFSVQGSAVFLSGIGEQLPNTPDRRFTKWYCFSSVFSLSPCLLLLLCLPWGTGYGREVSERRLPQTRIAFSRPLPYMSACRRAVTEGASLSPLWKEKAVAVRETFLTLVHSCFFKVFVFSVNHVVPAHFHPNFLPLAFAQNCRVCLGGLCTSALAHVHSL